MKKRNQKLLKALLLLVFMVFTTTLFFQSCQKGEYSASEDMIMKEAVIPLESPTLYWGHQQFTRTTGKPETETITISGADLTFFEGCLHLKIKNGDNGMNLVDNAVVKIDGVTVVFPGDFEGTPLLITKEICDKTGDFTLEIQLRGTPGSFMDVWIEGKLKPGYAVIDKSGGQITSEDGLVNISLPMNSVSQRTVFSVFLTEYPSLTNFNEELKGPAYLLKPHGYVFQEAVTIKLLYNPELFINQVAIKVLHWEVPQGIFEVVQPTIDTENHAVLFNVDHFSGIATFEESNSGTFVDERDGNQYNWVKIGNQVWMAENLAYLPSVNPPTDGSNTEPYYYVYDYSGTDVSVAKATANYSTYGVLYNWPAAMAGASSSIANPSGVKGACPAGWHLPSITEWAVLSNYLINNGYGYGGSGSDIAKSLAAKTHWKSFSAVGSPGNDPSSNNSSGFSGLPGGGAGPPYGFGEITTLGLWYSSTLNSTGGVLTRQLDYGTDLFYRFAEDKILGLSVRCIRD